jgi:hypothetical protein
MSAAAARDQAPLSDDAGLRTALRNVPLLPPPANVDDLLARLDAEDPRVSSGPLAELISDARYVEPQEESDDFFAPVSLAANTNRRSPLARRLWAGLFPAGLAAAAFLIAWNALVTPDSPPLTPATDRAEAATPIAGLEAPVQAEGTGEPAANRRDAAAPSEATSVPGQRLELPQAPTQPTSLAGPALEPVPAIPDLVVEAEILAQRLSETSLPADPEAASAASTRLPEALARTLEPIAAPEPIPPTDPEPMQGAQEPTIVFAEAEPAPAAPEPTPTIDVARLGDAVASTPPAEATAPESLEIVRTAEEQTVLAAQLPEATVSPEPQPDAVAAVPEPVEASATGQQPTVSPEPQPEATAVAAAPEALPTSQPALQEPAGDIAVPVPTRPRARERVPFGGNWAASPEACAPEMQDEGHLVARIGARGARAGNTGCNFNSIERKGSTWTIAALCSDGGTIWRSDVLLSLSRRRLTWTSRKGSTTYVRCPRA